MRKGSFYNGSFFCSGEYQVLRFFCGLMSVPTDWKCQKDIDKDKKAVGTGFAISGCG